MIGHKERLQFLSEGASVERYHTRIGIKPDSDGRHMHGVMVLASMLAGESVVTGHTLASASLLMAAATHDMAEQFCGDVSAPAKRALNLRDMLFKIENDKLKQYGFSYEEFLTDEESQILALADCFDGMLYCCRELALGNRNVMLVWRRFCSYIETLTETPGGLSLHLSIRASLIYEALKEIYHETTSPQGPSFDVFTQT